MTTNEKESLHQPVERQVQGLLVLCEVERNAIFCL